MRFSKKKKKKSLIFAYNDPHHGLHELCCLSIDQKQSSGRTTWVHAVERIVLRPS